MVEPNRLRGEIAPNTYRTGSAPVPDGIIPRPRRATSAPGALFVVGILFAIGAVVLIRGGVVGERGGLIAFCVGSGIALTALAVQLVRNQARRGRSASALAVGLFYLPHVLFVGSVGVGLLVTAIGMLLQSPPAE